MNGFGKKKKNVQANEQATFTEALVSVYALYRVDLSPGVAAIWWNALKGYDLVAVQDAFGRHAVNPDTGQFVPKPADVVKMLGGSTLDTAMQAWTKLERGVMRVGPYATVAFDDALIHRVVEDMGGWVQFGGIDEDQWPFTQKEFENRYRGYRARSDTPPYPPKLIGITDGHNEKNGFRASDVVLIGQADKARRVLAGGSDAPRLGFAVERAA
jgi:hypothetical protein